jgi:hypothetical protein
MKKRLTSKTVAYPVLTRSIALLYDLKRNSQTTLCFGLASVWWSQP